MGNLDEVFLTNKRRFIQDIINEHGIDNIAEADIKISAYSFKLMESVGGHEGGGDFVKRVIQIKMNGDKNAVFVKFTGSYASYCGTEYDEDFTFVEPREVKVIQYFDI